MGGRVQREAVEQTSRGISGQFIYKKTFTTATKFCLQFIETYCG